MKKIVLFILSASFSVTLMAGQKYNSYANKWETVPDDWVLKYNCYDNTWSYQSPNAQLEYNGFENKHEWNSGNNPSGCNCNQKPRSTKYAAPGQGKYAAPGQGKYSNGQGKYAR